MLNSLLYATSFTIFRGEMGGGGRTVERFWRFREIKRTLNGREKYIKQLLATTSAKKWSKCFINRKEEKDVDWLTFWWLSSIAKLSRGLPNYGLTTTLACVARDFFGRGRNYVALPSVTPPQQNRQLQTNAMLTLFRIAFRANTVWCEHGIVPTRYGVNTI